MALKRTKVLGWTKDMSATQSLINKMARAGDYEGANALNASNREAHQKRAAQILRNSRK